MLCFYFFLFVFFKLEWQTYSKIQAISFLFVFLQIVKCSNVSSVPVQLQRRQLWGVFNILHVLCAFNKTCWQTCAVFTCRVVRNVTSEAHLPAWVIIIFSPVYSALPVLPTYFPADSLVTYSDTKLLRWKIHRCHASHQFPHWRTGVTSIWPRRYLTPLREVRWALQVIRVYLTPSGTLPSAVLLFDSF